MFTGLNLALSIHEHVMEQAMTPKHLECDLLLNTHKHIHLTGIVPANDAKVPACRLPAGRQGRQIAQYVDSPYLLHIYKLCRIKEQGRAIRSGEGN
jgi:hypothetical protein